MWGAIGGVAYGSSKQQEPKNPDLMTQEKAEIKHTPGPWSADTGLGVFPEDGIPITDDATGEEICVAWPQSLDDAQVANARLISAAPDLLAALSDLLKEHTSIVHSEYDGTGKLLAGMLNTRAMKAARAAITKATNSKP